jgi:hypothetical protein
MSANDPALSLLKAAPVFVPELAPLVPRVVAAAVALAKIEPILAPAVARLEKNEPAFIELGEAVRPLAELMPEIRDAIATVAALRDLAGKYEQRIAAALR